MPNQSQKDKIADFLIQNAANEILNIQCIESEDDEDAVEKIYDSIFDDLFAVLFCRRGIERIVPKSSVWLNDVLTSLDDDRFCHMLRVDRAEFTFLLSLIEDDLEFKKPHACEQFPIDLQLAMVAYRLGSSGESATFNNISTIFGVGDGGTISKITKRILRVILKLQPQYIFWPDQKERDEIIAATFMELPFCVGYIDGTEIKIAESPVQNQLAYFSSNHIYSVKAQVVCDYKLRIRHVVFDAKIFRSCSLFKQKEKFISSQQWIAGGSVYPLSDYIITPYRSNSQQLDRNKRIAFNMRHSKYRVRVEHCFGVLKEKFGSLKQLRMRLHNYQSIKHCSDWFMACCILHNLFVKTSEAEGDTSSFTPEQSEYADLIENTTSKQAEIKRQALYSLMFE